MYDILNIQCTVVIRKCADINRFFYFSFCNRLLELS